MPDVLLFPGAENDQDIILTDGSPISPPAGGVSYRCKCCRKKGSSSSGSGSSMSSVSGSAVSMASLSSRSLKSFGSRSSDAVVQTNCCPNPIGKNLIAEVTGCGMDGTYGAESAETTPDAIWNSVPATIEFPCTGDPTLRAFFSLTCTAGGAWQLVAFDAVASGSVIFEQCDPFLLVIEVDGSQFGCPGCTLTIVFTEA